MSLNKIDSHKLSYHPRRVAEWLEQGDCSPIYVEIGLTNRCNHRCRFCALDWLERHPVDMDPDLLRPALRDMAAYGVKSIMFAGEGESLLHGDASLLIRHASDVGLKVALTTNGVPLDPRKAEECLPYLSWIRFSVNAGSSETYASVHNTRPSDFEKVLANIAAAVELKRANRLQVDIGVQCLILPDNVDELVRLAELVKKTGADNLQIKPYSRHPSSSHQWVLDQKDFLPLEPRLNSFESDSFKVFFRKETMQRIIGGLNYDHCHGLPFFALINARGEMIPCNLFYDRPEFSYGDLNRESFAAIWQGERRKGVLEKLARRTITECRQACRLDPINRYLHRLKYPELRDDFI